MHLSSAHPYLPVAPPIQRYPSSVPRSGQFPGATYSPTLAQAETPAVPAPLDPAVAAQKLLLKWGAVGVAIGAAANGLVTALAFRSYRDSKGKSLLGPALWAAGGSVLIGGTLLWILSRSVVRPIDQRVVAATVGAKLAA